MYPGGTFVTSILQMPVMNHRNAFLLLLMIFTGLTAQSQSRNESYSSNNDSRVKFRHSNGMTNFNVESRGKFELTDDDRDIKSMSSDGYLEITKTVFGSKRSVIISPQAGKMKYEYFEGRTQVAFEPDGRKWLSEILPELVRSTTIGAESRVNRFYRLNGTKGVLDEISKIESDYVKAHYANLLMDLPVPSKDYSTIANVITDQIESDHYRTEFYKKNMSKLLSTKESTDALFNATKKLESDHYKTEVIKASLRNGPASLDGVKIILQASATMESDHYKTEVLSALLKQSNLDDAVITEIISGTSNIESDYYRSVVLNRSLDRPGLSSTAYNRALESIRNIESDHYKTEVLSRIIKNNLTSENQVMVVNAASSIKSDHYATTVANQLVQKQNLSDEAFQKLLETIGTHDSDYYVSTFLQSALERQNISKQNLVAILKATGHIESDHYVTEVLTDAAPRIKALNDPSLKDAYRQAAKNIESETYYGRAMKAID